MGLVHVVYMYHKTVSYFSNRVIDSSNAKKKWREWAEYEFGIIEKQKSRGAFMLSESQNEVIGSWNNYFIFEGLDAKRV